MEKIDKSDLSETSEIIVTLREIAVESLARMYRPEERLFAFRLKKNRQSEVLQGFSRRYTATALIGLAGENEDIITKVLGDHSLEEVCDKLIRDIESTNDLGEVSLTVWAARTLRHARIWEALEALRRFSPDIKLSSTITLSWSLSALTLDSDADTDETLARKFAQALMNSFNHKSRIFLPGNHRKSLGSICSHVSCFADLVYPVQALSHYHKASSDSRAAEIACSCAERMCSLQGDAGQWWWHYDNRTGRIIERYPVYAVHQDAMAPMALLALEKSCGKSFSAAIDRGLNWLKNPVEIARSLIDTERKVIWRKVARHEPRKMVRSLQAAMSRIHPALRTPALNTLFPPCSIDYESRPYHMGWILYAWPDNKENYSAI
ncbi:MAG: hypothetical protein P8016_04515 [Sedimentisphaerales bacterium]